MSNLRKPSKRVFIIIFNILSACTSYHDHQVVYHSPVTDRVPSSASLSISTVDLKFLPDTIGIEHQDRVNRFGRLSKIIGMAPPEVDEMQVGVGQIVGFDYPVPVVRVQFDQRVFFDFDRDSVRPEAINIIKVIAENMKRDVPDAQLTILGHTDAIGTDDYNIDLSRRRAISVMQALVDNGVNPEQLSTVAVGKSQPVAPNSTEDGRARNRRVEFMISASEAANITLVSKRRIIEEYLKVNLDEAPILARGTKLSVLKPLPIKLHGTKKLQLAQTGTVQLKEPMTEAKMEKIAPRPDVKKMPLREFQKAKINNEFDL